MKISKIDILAKTQLPLKGKIKPFVLTGLKLDHIFKVSDWMFRVNGYSKDNYHDFIFNDYKQVITSGVLGFGIGWNDFVSIQYQYNFPLESSTKNNPIKIRDEYHGVTIGVTFLRLTKKSGM